MIKINPLFSVDSYKISHPRMYPDGTTYLKTYIESRGIAFEDVDITWVGFQMFVKELAKNRFTLDDIEEARDFYREHFMGADIFPYDDWKYALDKYYGAFPVRIQALAEGTTLPSHNVVATVESTDEKLFWMTSFLETMVLRGAWYSSSVATNDMKIASVIYKYLMLTSDAPDALYPSRNHDFGARGATSSESAAIAGAVHTLISGGSDTVEGIYYAKKMYDYKGMPAFSLPASEHSVTTAYGRKNEYMIVNKSLNCFPDAPMVANVIDSYDMMNFVDNIVGIQYKQDIIDSGKLFICRPDSGDAVSNVIDILRSLERNFGVTMNNKGYKILNHVAVINGDGNNYYQISEICKAVMKAGFALDNVAFGTGGNLHQMVNRDTYRWALKLCLAQINGEKIAISKEPKNDIWKKSRAGDLDLIQDFNGNYQTIDRLNCNVKNPSVLETVYLNGVNPVTYNFVEVKSKIFSTVQKMAKEMLIT